MPSGPIIEVIRKYVSDSRVLTDVATDLAMQLPLGGLSKFPAMFNELDEKKAQLKY